VVLRDERARLDDAPGVADDGAAADERDADAHRLVELARHLRGEAEFSEQRDDRPRGDFVGERRDEAPVHDAGRTLVAFAGREARHHLAVLDVERETKPDGVVGAAAEARLTGAENRAVHGRGNMRRTLEVWKPDASLAFLSSRRVFGGPLRMRSRDQERGGARARS